MKIRMIALAGIAALAIVASPGWGDTLSGHAQHYGKSINDITNPSATTTKQLTMDIGTTISLTRDLQQASIIDHAGSDLAMKIISIRHSNDISGATDLTIDSGGTMADPPKIASTDSVTLNAAGRFDLSDRTDRVDKI